jgi:hypothetical protein
MASRSLLNTYKYFSGNPVSMHTVDIQGKSLYIDDRNRMLLQNAGTCQAVRYHVGYQKQTVCIFTAVRT